MKLHFEPNLHYRLLRHSTDLVTLLGAELRAIGKRVA